MDFSLRQTESKHLRLSTLASCFERVNNRTATKRAYALADQINTAPAVDDESRKLLFNQDASTTQLAIHTKWDTYILLHGKLNPT